MDVHFNVNLNVLIVSKENALDVMQVDIFWIRLIINV